MKRLIHKAKLVSPDGDVSPLCASIPRALNLRIESWTTDNSAVTCKNCKSKMGVE